MKKKNVLSLLLLFSITITISACGTAGGRTAEWWYNTLCVEEYNVPREWVSIEGNNVYIDVDNDLAYRVSGTIYSDPATLVDETNDMIDLYNERLNSGSNDNSMDTEDYSSDEELYSDDATMSPYEMYNEESGVIDEENSEYFGVCSPSDFVGRYKGTNTKDEFDIVLIEGYPNLIRILVKDGTQEEFTESHNVYSGAAVALHADDNDPIHKATVISGFGWELYLTRDDNGNASISATVGIITDIYFTRTSTTPEQTYQG